MEKGLLKTSYCLMLVLTLNQGGSLWQRLYSHDQQDFLQQEVA